MGRPNLFIEGRLATGEKRSQAPSKLQLARLEQKRLHVEEQVVGEVEVSVRGSPERVLVDEYWGPEVRHPDGRVGRVGCVERGELWPMMSFSTKKALILIAATKNRQFREEKEAAELLAAEEDRALRAHAEKTPQSLRQARCQNELAKPFIPWVPITLDIVMSNHNMVAPGLFYGIEFPWSETMLVKFGPAWLTKAFHAAGTLHELNRVVEIIPESTIKITAGNNGGKFLFEVRYKRQTPDLHTKLFAKVPYPMTQQTKTDRLSSSVFKQPMDFAEINTYRLMENNLPCKVPKFYYGDISNKTSNFILITARIPFSDFSASGRRQLEPFEIEGPYDKCKDYGLRSTAKEYYGLIITQLAKIAAYDQSGKLGDDSVLSTLCNVNSGPPEAFGVNLNAATGQPPAKIKAGVETAVKFITETARVLFPSYVQEEKFKTKFRNLMMQVSAYRAEIAFWKHMDPKYVAMGHSNLNIDNAYFWRDASGELDCGVLDWGGFGRGCIGHKLWWALNCSDFELIRDNLADFLQIYVENYLDSGGPDIDLGTLEMMLCLTALENTLQMVLAIPNSLKMCSAKEFATIKDWHDPRIAADVDGKSTLRTTLHVLNNGVRLIEEMGMDTVFERWVQTFIVEGCRQQRKSEKIVWGM